MVDTIRAGMRSEGQRWWCMEWLATGLLVHYEPLNEEI